MSSISYTEIFFSSSCRWQYSNAWSFCNWCWMIANWKLKPITPSDDLPCFGLGRWRISAMSFIMKLFWKLIWLTYNQTKNANLKWCYCHIKFRKTSTHSKTSLCTLGAIYNLQLSEILQYWGHISVNWGIIMLQATKMKLVTVWLHKIS